MAAWYAFDDCSPQFLVTNNFLSLVLELLHLLRELTRLGQAFDVH